MRRILLAACVSVLVVRVGGLAIADDNKDANPVIDKAVQALGGEEKLKAAKIATWKGKGTITIQGNESEIATTTTVQGLDHSRQEFKGEFGGNQVEGVTIIAGDKGWRKFGEREGDIEGDRLAAEKRNLYLATAGANPLLLKDAAFKIQSVSEEKVGDKSAVAIKSAGPDGKDFQIHFDKETGLPVKLTAVVVGRNGEEFKQETTYDKYSVFDGLKRATKIEIKRNGETFMTSEISDFKVLDKVESSTFAAP